LSHPKIANDSVAFSGHGSFGSNPSTTLDPAPVHRMIAWETVLGTTIGSYVIRAKVGQGGMGSVYVAEHATLGRRAAIKVLQPELSNDRSVVTRFFNEARAASAIHHPSIVEIYDFGYTADANAFIVMEFLDGETLAKRRYRVGRMDPRRSLVFARQIAGALAAAHELGIVHRDLKPENIFVVPDPEVHGGERIKLLDFGIAKLQNGFGDTSRTQTGSVLGTPAYMAPEQCRGAGTVDARADLYALGCVTYELLVGRPPFVADGAGDLIAHHLYFEPLPLRQLDATVPEPVERLVLWLLTKDPARRPQTARDLIGIGTATDAQIAPTMPGSAPTVPTPTTLSGASGVAMPTPALVATRRRWVVPVVAVTAVAAGLAIYFAVANKSSATTVEVTAQKPSEPTPAARPAPEPTTPPAKPPEPAKPLAIKLTIDSDPTSATVVFAGNTVGTTPFVDTIEPGADKRVYTIQKDGYDSGSATLSADRDATEKVVLKKKKKVIVKPPPPPPGIGDRGVNPFDK
jgi:serine/threonine-protein kinase